MHTGKPTGVAVSGTVIIVYIGVAYTRGRGGSTGQLRTLIPRGYLEYCDASRLRQLILV